MLMRMMYRVIISLLETSFNGTLLKRDVEQAYVQSRKLQLKMYIHLPKVQKFETLHYHHIELSSWFFQMYYPLFSTSLVMTSAPFDPFVLFKTSKNGLTRIVRLAADNSLKSGDLEHRKAEQDFTGAFVTKKHNTLLL